MTKLLVT